MAYFRTIQSANTAARAWRPQLAAGPDAPGSCRSGPAARAHRAHAQEQPCSCVPRAQHTKVACGPAVEALSAMSYHVYSQHFTARMG